MNSIPPISIPPIYEEEDFEDPIILSDEEEAKDDDDEDVHAHVEDGDVPYIYQSDLDVAFDMDENEVVEEGLPWPHEDDFDDGEPIRTQAPEQTLQEMFQIESSKNWAQFRVPPN